MFYKSKKTNGTLLGAKITYSGNVEKNNLTFQNTDVYMASRSNDIYMRLKCNVYVNTKINPFDEKEEVDESETSKRMLIYCKVILSFDGHDLMYYNGVQWKDIESGKTPEYTSLVFMNSGNWNITRVLNTWLTNSTVHWTGVTAPNTVIDKEKNFNQV